MNTTIDYKILLRSCTGLFLIVRPDAEFTIVDASDTYLNATQTERHAIVGKGIFEVFPDNPADLEATGVRNLRRSLLQAIESKMTDFMPVQKYDIRTSEGQYQVKYWSPQNMPVLDASGKVIYLIHQVEDVTEIIASQRKMEEDKRRSDEIIAQKSGLIARYSARTGLIRSALSRYSAMDFSVELQIPNENDALDAISADINLLIQELKKHTQLLSSTNRELEFANKELDSFSHSVSHDLRAPLRAINGYAHVLLEDYESQLPDTAKEAIRIIVRNAARMARLIDDLLAFSRVGKQALKKTHLDMDMLAATTIQDLIAEHKKSDIQWTVKPLAPCDGDRSMILQVMNNLIGNAIKYSSKKQTSEIEVGSYIDGAMVVYYIKDNGAGFDMRYYDKLFGVFQRLHGAKEFEGTGVGLAHVQRIIRKHQGEVWAEGEPGNGATFFFSLPIIKTKPDSDDSRLA